MTIEKKLLGTTPVSGVGAAEPEATSFDGSTDYLSKSSDLTGNADGKTFTFSCWIYYTGLTSAQYMYRAVGGMTVQLGSNFMHLDCTGTDQSWPPAIYMNLGAALTDITPLTWFHFLVSVDVTSTSNRKVYINDIDVSSSADWYDGDGWYRNAPIDFTRASHVVGTSSSSGSSGNLKGRMAHLYLDYTYRDLSTVSNRRLFIDSDGKPSSTIPSSPILYLPMTDAATAGSNSGTGGDFTVNGTLDTAGRAPNQDNCSASEFDGANDYLQITSGLSGVSDSKTFTVSGAIHPDSGASNGYVMGIINQGDSVKLLVEWNVAGGMSISAQPMSPNSYSLSFTIPSATFPKGSSKHFTLSIDVSNTSKRHVIVEGEDITSSCSFNTYQNTALGFSASHVNVPGGYSANSKFDGSIGELYFDTVYTDLATDNPFWDSDANRPKPVRQVISGTATER